ncbi:MAG: matrixin family metalloprotease [Deltaproteobacteria bacterium]|nr:matrixin family metalloprotease [Deltaproteobacteria bacterium]MCB9488595.1 matrixin family metalloprotease [Deltaproteobacteria bacterium]
MTRRPLAVAALAAALIAGAFAAPARAYEYNDCLGHACRWDEFPVKYVVNEDLDDILFPGAVQAALDSFSRWNYDRQTFCGIDLAFGGLTDKAGMADDRQNVIYAETRRWDFGRSTLAITQCFFGADGMLRDCDVAINAVDWRWSDEENPPEGTLNLRDALTHEAGHFWGLGHSRNDSATMNPAPARMHSPSDLDEDDIRAAAESYCPNDMPADDEFEQNDSTQTVFGEHAALGETGLRLYDTDVWRFRFEDGQFPKIVVYDHDPERRKIVRVYDVDGDQLGWARCDGDCVAAPATGSLPGGVAFVSIETDFVKSPISHKKYDIYVGGVDEVDPGELTDDDLDDPDESAESEASTKKDKAPDESGGCQVTGSHGEPAPLAVIALALLFVVTWARRRA